jgi:8-oxo-dGTP pyrophosphatase MutT (NUDIX family)
MLLTRLRTALGATAPPGYRGDWEVTAEAAPEPARALMPAAVLIAVSDEPEPQLLLTRRSAALTRHAGQIAFPGGRIDPEDADAVAAALREAEEEVALDRRLVEVVGTLEPYETGTGFSILPVVGIVPPALVLTPHEREVAEVFHVPFAHILDTANHERRTGEWQGRARQVYVIRHGVHEIWGATAAILVNLARLVA